MIASTNIINSVKNITNLAGKDSSNHVWQFSRVGGVNRVNLDSGADLINLEFLDQKLWTALSCPVHGLEIDAKTLELIDTDNDGKIRVPEIRDAVKWITSVINDPNDLIKKNKSLPLLAINDKNTLGKSLLASARQILKNLERPDANEITVDETKDIIKIFANTKFNGDDIITEDSTEDPEEKNLINYIITIVGSATDRNGKEGITQEHLNEFFKLCTEYSDWRLKAENNNKILPFNENTETAFAIYSLIKPKIDDYFLRCKLAEFNPQDAEKLNTFTAKIEIISSKELSSCLEEIATFPLTRIESDKLLSLNKAVNPAWENQFTKFKQYIIEPLYNSKDALAEQEWNNISEKFTEFITWKSEKKGEAAEKLGLSTVRKILSENRKKNLEELIIKDSAFKCESENIFLVDKMVRLYCDISTLLNNFVTFHDFYSPHAESIFQVGSLYIDQRSCDLCIRVNDISKHSSIAGSSGICLLYCECFSKKKNEKMTIVAALTDGDIDNITVGRNAIFYDRKGNDWDATIVKIIDNPISIRQAFWSPYRKVSKMISTQMEKVASAKEKEVHSTSSSGIEKTSAHVDTGISKSLQSTSTIAAAPAQTSQTPKVAEPFDIGKFVGIFAAIGLALGAIGSVLASVLAGFLGLIWWKMPIAFAGIILAISGPSMIIAYLKLRKRNLAPILDANGWAINAKATINIPFGNSLTHLAVLPKNSKLNLLDPFAKKKRPWIPVVIGIVILLGAAAYFLWHYGFLQKWGIL